MASDVAHILEEMENADSSEEFESSVLDKDYTLDRKLEGFPSRDTDYYDMTSPSGYKCHVYWDDQQVQTLVTQFEGA